MIKIHFFTCSCPVFPAPLIEETVFPTLCSIASFVIDCEAVKVAELCPTLWDPGIFQARILKWVAFPFSMGSSRLRGRTQVSRIAGDSSPAEPPGKPKNTGVGSLSLLQGIFPTQESNRGLLHCRRILYQLSYQGICSWQEGWHWFGPTLNGIKMSGFREWDWIGVLSSIFIHQREKM